MFERYTEKARRVIFFSRYEASEFGSSYIEPEHLLLGLMRENTVPFVDEAKKFELRAELAGELPRGKRIPTSVDLPLSTASKRVLAYGAEEAEQMSEQHIQPGHLVLGILRIEDTLARRLLLRRGITIERVRDSLMHSQGTASRDKQIVDELKREIERMSERLTYEIEPAVSFRLKALDDRP
jgi:ATP-dependent Clp protease ATP-binding subunit ClpC